MKTEELKQLALAVARKVKAGADNELSSGWVNQDGSVGFCALQSSGVLI